jgi:hypothetical protein
MLSDLRTFLLADPTISGMVGGARIYPQMLAQNTAYPEITYSQVSGVREYSMCGPVGRARPRVSIHSWSPNYGQARDLADAVRERLNGYAGMMGSTEVDAVKLDNEFDDMEPEASVRRVIQDYFISHLE